MGMQLATIDSQAENDFLEDQMDAFVDSSWWMGLTDLGSEGNHYWIDGSDSTFENWANNQPNNSGNQDCVEVFTSGSWNDEDCDDQQPFACESPCDDGVACTIDTFDSASGECVSTPSDALCDDGDPCTVNACDAVAGCTVSVEPVSMGASSYLFCTDDRDFSDAEATCAAVGMSLVTIDDSAENDFVSLTAAGLEGGPWSIGYTDQGSEGDFYWFSGSMSTFTAWCSGEPNNLGNEDCTLINWCSGGGWNDISCGSDYPFVCEANCDDGNPCTDDAYDAATGTCSNTNNSALCDDGDACTDGRHLFRRLLLGRASDVRRRRCLHCGWLRSGDRLHQRTLRRCL